MRPGLHVGAQPDPFFSSRPKSVSFPASAWNALFPFPLPPTRRAVASFSRSKRCPPPLHDQRDFFARVTTPFPRITECLCLSATRSPAGMGLLAQGLQVFPAGPSSLCEPCVCFFPRRSSAFLFSWGLARRAAQLIAEVLQTGQHRQVLRFSFPFFPFTREDLLFPRALRSPSSGFFL